MAHYLDTSALVKLVVAEPETASLLTWLRLDERGPTSSELARTELLRAVRRVAPERMLQARAVLDAVVLLEVTTPVLEHAGELAPAALRSLDALHLAAALALGDDLEAVVTYDDRLGDAASAHGLRVLSPAAGHGTAPDPDPPAR